MVPLGLLRVPAGRHEVRAASAVSPAHGGPFHLLLLDPPYASGAGPRALAAQPAAPGAWASVETARDEAVEVFERLLALRNDLGLLSEEYDQQAHRLVGNFPQAFSHVGLVNAALCLEGEENPDRSAPPRQG